MRKQWFLYLVLCFLTPGFSSNAQLITYKGKQFYLNGPNVCWNNYGWDFGDNAYGWGGGNGYNATWWEAEFTKLQNYGANSARVWVHCKGELNPLFNGSGHCTGLNNNFFNNMDDMMNRAKNHNIMIILCLWDFHLVNISGRQDVVKDAAKTTSYINNALIPIVQRYANQCNLLAYEVINEPEWIMSGVPGAGNFGGSITITEMQRFVGMCATAIHANSTKYVTVGSASLRWNSDVAPASANYWKNSTLQSAYSNAGAYLDFYQIHYYDWMLQSGNNHAPYNRPASYWGLDKPVLIGETGNTSFYNYQQQFDLGYSNGFAGTMVWASGTNSGGAAVWTDFNNQMKNFRDAHPSIVDFDCNMLGECQKPTLGPDITLCGGITSVTLNSNITNTVNKVFTWYRNGVVIGGATSSSYGPTSVAGTYVISVDSLSGACIQSDTIILSSALVVPELGPGINLCNPASVNLDAGSYGATPVTYQWKLNGTDIAGATSRYYNNVRVAGTYSITVSSSGCSPVTDIIAITSSLAAPVDGCNSAPGSVNLSVTGSGNFNWYSSSSGGSILPGGNNTNNFTTPSISSTTTYYVEDASSVAGQVGPVSQFGGGYGRNPVTDDARFRLNFNTGAQSVTINSVKVWAWFNAAGTTYYINLRILDASLSVMNSISIPVTHTAAGWAAKVLPVGITIPAGVTGWKMDAKGSMSSPVCDLYYAPSGASYSYNSSPAGMITITGHDATWEPNGYSFFYDWNISTGTVCSRLPVIATIGSCGALPVYLKTFSVRNTGNENFINWVTASEINLSHFLIERVSGELNGPDKKIIAQVLSSGNPGSTHAYQWKDEVSSTGIWYYRIIAVDHDGTEHEFTWKQCTSQAIDFSLYPNPADDKLEIILASIYDQETEIVIRNVLGEIVFSSGKISSKGIQMEIDIANLPEGTYFCLVQQEGYSGYKKFAKQ